MENLIVLRDSYKFLEKINLNKKNLESITQFNFQVFTTFSKNISNLQNLFEFSEIPNFYKTFEISEDRIGFYIIYPKDKYDEFIGRIRLIHSEEVPILKKYLTNEGINYGRLNILTSMESSNISPSSVYPTMRILYKNNACSSHVHSKGVLVSVNFRVSST